MSPCANASTIFLGMMFIRNSTVDCGALAVVVMVFRAVTSNLVASIFIPAPGRIIFMARSPINKAIVVRTSKYNSDLAPTDPTFFRSCMPAMPVTIVQKITGPIIIFTSLIKPSPKGLRLTAVSGLKCPSTIPMRIATITCR